MFEADTTSTWGIHMTALPPAGWYPDALDPTAKRWWDGSAWTVHVRRPDAAASVSVAPAPVLSRRELREQVGPLTRGEPEEPASAVAVLERPAEISSAEYARRAGGYEPRAFEPLAYTLDPSIVVYGSVHTLPAWLIASSPLWYAGMTAIVGGVVGVLSPTSSRYVGFPLLGLFVGMLVLLARLDTTRLAERGYLPPSPKWGWLPFVYLIMRIARTGSRSAALLVTYVLAQLAYVVAIIIVVIALLAPILGSGQYDAASGGGPAAQPGGGVTESPEVILTPDERQYFLTREGIEGAVSGMLDATFVIDELHCSTFDEPTPDTTATCLLNAEGKRWVVILELAPETENFPFSIVDVSELVDATVDS